MSYFIYFTVSRSGEDQRTVPVRIAGTPVVPPTKGQHAIAIVRDSGERH